MVLVFDEVQQGLVQVRKDSTGYCIYQTDLLPLLGYETCSEHSDCLTPTEIEDKLDLRIMLDTSKMRILILPAQSFPLLDMRKAYLRHNENQQKSRRDNFIVRKTNSLLPKLSGLGAEIVQLNGLKTNYARLNSRIQFMGGSLSNNTTFSSQMYNANTPSIEHNFQWSWFNPTENGTLQSIRIGNNIGWSREGTALSGLSLSNKPLFRSSFMRYSNFGLQLQPGSIIEWVSPVDQVSRSEFISDGNDKLSTELQQGLNTLRFKLTEPGNRTREITKSIYVPDGMISKNKLEYHLKMGFTQPDATEWIIDGSLVYGLFDHMSISLDSEHFLKNSLDWDKTYLGLNSVLFDHFDVRGKVNTKQHYDLRLAYQQSSLFNFSIRDRQLFDDKSLISSVMKRTSSVQWSLNLPTKIWVHSFAERRKSQYGESLYSSLSLNQSRNRLMLGSQFSLQANRFTNTTFSHSLNTRQYLSTRFYKKYSVGFESNISHNRITKIESLALNAQYYSKSFQVNTSMVRIPNTNNALIQLGIRFQSKHILSNQQLSVGQSDLNYWSSYATAWNITEDGKWLGTSGSGTHTSGLEFRAFLDENWNGLKDKHEPLVHGLMPLSRGSKVTNTRGTNGSLLFLEMIPQHQYWIAFESELYHHSEYTLVKPTILVQAPSDGIRTMYLPVRKSEELYGIWSSDSPLLNSVDVKAELHDEINGTKYKIQLFSDQTWLVNSIPEGRYTLIAERMDGKRLRIRERSEIVIPLHTSSNMLSLFFETS
jgi:hypothetical protein